MSQTAKRKKNIHLKGFFEKVFVCSDQKLAPFGTAFVFPPENFDEHSLGTLFGVIKVDDHSNDSSYVVNLLTSVIKKEYFSKTERDPEQSFETSLRKANLALAELARHGSLGWSGKINFAAGALEKSTLHFSTLGNGCVFLLRSGQIVEISHELSEEKSSESHPLKTFSDISSGKLEKNDKLIFTTGDLLEIFSKEELRHNASHFSAEEFPGFIEISLQANSQLAGTVILDMKEDLPTEPLEKHFFRPKKEGSTIPMPEAEKFVSPVKAHLDIKTREKSEIEDEPVFDEFPKKYFPEKLTDSLKKIAIFSSGVLSRSGKAVSSFLSRKKDAYSEPQPRLRRVTGKIAGIAGKGISGTKNFFDNLPKFIAPEKRKSLVIAVISIAAVVLIIFAFRSKRQSDEPSATQSQTESAAQEPTPQQKFEDIQAKEVGNLDSLANFSGKAGGIALLDGAIYAVSDNDQSVLKINPDSKNSEEIKNNIGEDRFKLIASMPNLGTIFLLTDDNKIISLTPINKNFQNNNIPLPDNLEAAGIRTYLTYLYLLDPSADQIYRFPRAEGGFGERQDWLKPGNDISQAKSFAINEDLYVCGPNGVTAYLQGKKDSNISFEMPRTPLLADEIFSEPDMEYIYALDNKNHRVIQYSKAGKINAQFHNEQISDFKDFAVDEKMKRVYLMKDGEILEFSFE